MLCTIWHVGIHSVTHHWEQCGSSCTQAPQLAAVQPHTSEQLTVGFVKAAVFLHCS